MRHGYSKIYDAEDDKEAIKIIHEIAEKYPDYNMYILIKEPADSNLSGVVWTNTVYSVLDINIHDTNYNRRKYIISNMIKRDYNISANQITYIPIDTSGMHVITAKELSSFIKKFDNGDTKNDEIDIVVYTAGGDDEDDTVKYRVYMIDEFCVDDETKNVMIKVV